MPIYLALIIYYTPFLLDFNEAQFSYHADAYNGLPQLTVS